MAFRKVAEHKEVSLQYLSNGPATFQWFTDMPGGALTARLGAGVALPSTAAARKTITIPLDGLQGTEFYPVITPANATQLELFSGTVWVRPIGVYIDGSLGEIWSTPPLSLGT
jgi:hypothetical protein